ncbi:hypothetical protein LXT21_23210 [Myxococcus sp. K38C18041901]|uniref:terpene synthase family protein n=1 Tax=Myxococcus guangdongensis TaxID=2906760 RepID=UPI0020A791E9|nr:hypothetical protein [Myxococcus guangdongensis]MCP3061699.1 hypothetical protein [Myxococcus guangdongensis]
MQTSTPRVELPFLPGLSPDREASRATTLRWMAFHGLVVGHDALWTYDKMRTDLLSARVFCDARGAGLDLANEWIAWFFVFDDQFDGPLGRDLEATHAVLEEFLSAVQTGTPLRHPSSPLCSSWIDLWGRSISGMSETWAERFAGNFLRYFQSYQREALDRLQGGPADLASYLDNRRHTIGFAPALDLCEPASGYEIPPELHGSEPMVTMRLMSTDVVVIANDICSATKEAAVGQMHNVVLLRMRDEGCDQSTATQWAAGLIADRVRTFQEAESRMRQGTQTVTAWSYIDRGISAMKNWMRGNLDWSYETARYSSTDELWSSERTWPWEVLHNAPKGSAKSS